VRPPLAQGNLKELARELFGPDSLIHALQAMRRLWDTHQRGVPSGDV
jgi:hypothetical protein